MSSKTVTLEVNGSAVPLSFFVQAFFDKVLDGMVGALESTCTVDTLELKAGVDEITLTVNDSPISLNEFVRQIVRKTAQGMVESLRGINNVDTFPIRIAGGR